MRTAAKWNYVAGSDSPQAENPASGILSCCIGNFIPEKSSSTYKGDEKVWISNI